jgi:hypothetical protein
MLGLHLCFPSLELPVVHHTLPAVISYTRSRDWPRRTQQTGIFCLHLQEPESKRAKARESKKARKRTRTGKQEREKEQEQESKREKKNKKARRTRKQEKARERKSMAKPRPF